MNPVDIRDLALNLSGLLAGLDDHTTRGPLLVTRDGEPEAVIIRHKAWAPRLDRFVATYDEGYRCLDCEQAGKDWVTGLPIDLKYVLEAANRHWREQHMGPRR